MGLSFSAWVWDPSVLVALLAAALGYAVLLGLARRRGVAWPWWRVAAFVVLGLGSIALCCLGFLAAYQTTLAWALPVQLTLLMAIVPVLLALGDPLGLARAALTERGQRRWDGFWASAPIRVLTFPLLAAVLGAVTLIVVFFTGYLHAALAHHWVMELLRLHVVAAGCLLALPLLGVELLPAWINDGLRFLFGVVDGIVDAIPGLFLMTSQSLVAGGWFVVHRPSWAGTAMHDQRLGGVLMLVLSEVAAVPLLGILFFRWARNELRTDRADARAVRRSPDEDEVWQKPWWEQ